jgi:hypothetical protein
MRVRRQAWRGMMCVVSLGISFSTEGVFVCVFVCLFVCVCDTSKQASSLRRRGGAGKSQQENTRKRV